MRLTKKVKDALKSAHGHVYAIAQSMSGDDDIYSKNEAKKLFTAADYISHLAYKNPKPKSNESKDESP